MSSFTLTFLNSLSEISKILFLIIFLSPQISLGNDSAACIGMGGLVFQKNDQIKMLSEDLKISPRLVQVEYLYRNESDKDIELLVAFPIPSIDFVYSMMAIPKLNWWNFKTLVNGQEIEWFPLDPYEKDVGKIIYPENFQRFITESKIELFNPYIEDGSGCFGSESHIGKYYSILRVQKFPANETVKVYHEYSPAVGSGIPKYSSLVKMKKAILGKDKNVSDRQFFKLYLIVKFSRIIKNYYSIIFVRDKMIKRILIPDILQPVSHYCHAVEANGIIWISGLVGMNYDGTIPENTKDQFDIAMKDFNTCLEAAGGSYKDVVKVRVFLTNIDDRTIINPKRIEYFGEHKPASTLLEVSALVDPRMKVEIEAVAYLNA